MTPAAFGGLRAEGLALSRGERRLFTNLSFTLGAGGLLRLLGPNGSGKSSLLRGLLGLAPLAAGTLFSGTSASAPPLRPRALCAGALYQGHASGAKGELTALENLALSAALDGTAGPADESVLREALASVGLARQRDIETRRLSQGQRQRLSLARFALALRVPARPLWLMDEPSAALDAEGGVLLARMLAEHLARGGAAIVATHLPVAPDTGRIDELRLDDFAPRRGEAREAQAAGAAA
ncbi:MAG: heme ABC exporter ATP-binding protein CcmA [Burkholderiales bacterium]|nr:MAG: heme ABC exporter ATP-binding protein CcmA [Burkholderiales bacterium]